MSNIIDSIQLSGTVYTIQGSGGGSGNPTVELTQAEYDALVSAGTVAQDTYYIITDAPEVNPNDYVKKVDNNASGYVDTNSAISSSYDYSDAFNETVYWYTTNSTMTGNMQVGYARIYTGSSSVITIYFNAGLSDGVITANNTSNYSDYVTIEIVNGEFAVTPNSGYYWKEVYTSNSTSYCTKKVYSSGQSRNVIENTIYDVLDARNKQINVLDKNAFTAITTNINNGHLTIYAISKNVTKSNDGPILTSSTINYDGGLNVEFSSTTEGQKVINTGGSNYCSLFNVGFDVNKAFHDLTVVMNSGYTGGLTTSEFPITFLDSGGSTKFSSTFTYNVTNNSIDWVSSAWETFATVTDTLSTDYTIKITAKEGYLISSFGNNSCSIGGVHGSYPNQYITNLITTTSNVHNGQDVIDDLYANKQDTLSAGTGISIVDNVISATGGGGGMSSGEVQTMIDESISGKVDTSAITSSVTSASTDNEIPTAKAVYDAITSAVSGKASQSDLETVSGQVANKQDTLVSGTNIKAINNESILGSGNIDIQGGGGTTYSAGTNISIANDTINCTLPISARTNSNIEYGSVNNTFSYNSGQSNKVDLNHLNGTGNTLTNSSSAIGGLKNNFINGVTNTLSMNGVGGNLNYNFINGETNQLTSDVYSKPSISYNFINGTRNTGDTTNYCIISGLFNESKKSKQNLFGNNLIGNNDFETVFGQYNVSSSASTTFGNSGNTIFSIGNGTSSARHNAFEIRQNADIYVSNGTSDVKLQDYLQIKVVKLTQAEYDALSPNYDANTLYIIKD